MIRDCFSLLLVTVLLASARGGFADEKIRPMRPSELPLGTKTEKLVRVAGARVAYAKYDALRRDFPALKKMSNEAIDHWILDNFAVMSPIQKELDGIRHTVIPLDSRKESEGYRPPEYGRAAIVEAKLEGQALGMIDLKGIGHREDNREDIEKQKSAFAAAGNDAAALNELRTRQNSSGGMDLPEAIRETIRQQAVQKGLKAKGLGYETVESYFIIELPFDWIRADGQKRRAAIYGRQAHFGREPMSRDFEEKISEVLAPGAMGSMQTSLSGSIVDFGANRVVVPETSETIGAWDGPGKYEPNGWAYKEEAAFTKTGDRGALTKFIESVSDVIPHSPLQTATDKSAIEKFFDYEARLKARAPDQVEKLTRMMR